jgi:hypothetical protein
MTTVSQELQKLILGAIGDPNSANELITDLQNSGTSSVNGLTGDVVLAAGTNVTITPSGNTLTIASTGGGGGGANVTLSNLTSPTAVNQPLIFGATATPTIQSVSVSSGGSSTVTLTSGAVTAGSGLSGNLSLTTGSTFNANSGNIALTTGSSGGGDSSGNITLTTGAITSGGDSGNISLITTNATGAGGGAGNITIAPGTGSSGATAGQVILNSVLGTAMGSVATTTLTGSAGTASCSQPFQGSSYNKVVIYLNGYTDTGTQTYTFPKAFANAPYVYGLTGGVAGATVTATTIKFTVTTQTGFVFVEGY